MTTAPSPFAFTVSGQVFFDPHPGKQRDVLEVLKARVMGDGSAPSNVFLWGNRGGGKSRLVRSFLHACAMAFPGFRYVVVRRNQPDLRANHTIYLRREMAQLRGDDGGWNDTLGIATYVPVGGKQSLGFYRQCEDERDAEKVVGAEAAALFVDEATQIPWDILRMMGPSLRVAIDPTTGKMPFRPITIYGGNPIGESTEDIWAYFVDHTVNPGLDPSYDPADFLAMEFHRADNPSVDEREYQKQFAGLAPHYRAAWLDGVRLDARTLFDVHKTKDGKPYHYISELPLVGATPLTAVPWIQIYRAFDMGYFPDPAVCVWLAVLGRRVIAVHEETWFRTTAPDLAAHMKQVTTELVGETPVAMTYVDPQIDVRTGDIITILDQLELHGVPCEASINDRVLYADAIHGLLGEEVEPGVPRFQIYEPGCPMLAKYLPKMRWDEKNPRKMADHKFDHWIVALAYFAISSGVISQTSAPEQGRDRPAWMDWIEEDRRRRVH